MLLTLNHHYPSPPPPPKPLTTAALHHLHLHLHLHRPHHNPLPLYPIPKTLILQRPQNPPKPLTRSSNPHHSSPETTLPRTAIQRIAEKLRSLGFTTQETHKIPKLDPNTTLDGQKPGEIFIPLPNQLSKYRVGHTLDPSWSTPESPVPRPGSGNAIATFRELRKVVRRERFARKGEGKAPTLAELTLSEEELRRLTTLGIKENRKLKVGKAGITEGIVNGIHERWRRAEVVKIVCEDLCRENMKRTHDLLERKTGGLVVWRSGSKIILYRGANYKYPYFLSENNSVNETSDDAAVDTAVYSGEIDKLESCTSGMDNLKPVGQSSTNKVARPALIQGVGSPNRVRFQLPGEAQLSEEGDRLLDGLGPRFTDWWGCEPLPIDADLLPAVVSGYRKPFRLLPYGVKLSLTNDEMTTLRRLSRSLPCHFALGRNRKLQGLAAAIVKLWEKCEVAKIAVKRGVQNTNSELMAEELKWLTGGTMISRDREFIVLYRGKDFLPAAVSSAIEERRKHVIHGGKHWIEHSSAVDTSKEVVDGTADCNSEDKHEGGNNCSGDLSKENKLRHTDAAIKRTRIKLSMALEKKAKAEKLLEELEKAETPQQPEIDKEGITEEERYMLRKVGLKMKPFLLMGRRGVFDGTIENMHLHWKYRELVKIICKERSYGAVREAAETLEAESGGILVAVERVSKGHAIIVYRGKNYMRPVSLRPQTLMNKREAMKRSKEAQRRESLKLHVLRLTGTIDDLKLQLDKDKEAQNIQSFDGSSFEVKAKENKESGTCVEADSEPNLDPHNYSASSDYNEEKVESEERNFSPLVSGEQLDSVNETMGSIVHSDKNELKESSSVVVNKKDEKPSRVILSNRDKLLLRRQALKTKKRPVLAVGRSNIVTGVAKAIKDHFKRYPLAIVNVKGRAKGTSVQEVVFQLEQATGAVLVSQEPSKVILYRGWGADEEGPARKGKKNGRDSREKSGGREPEAPHTVSPELIEAIRFECGLQSNQEKEANALFIHQKP